MGNEEKLSQIAAMLFADYTIDLIGDYRVEIAFPVGPTTNYGICLPVAQEMKATVGIVTEELRLIERFFQPLKKILREGM